MVFYDKEGNKYSYNISKDSYFDRGRNAKVYKICDDECLKVLNRDPSNYFNEKVYDIIKYLSLDGLVKLGIPFYIDGKIKAYTMEYLEKTKISILDMPTEYTLDNLARLHKEMVILANNNIETFDLYYRNAIVGDSNIKLIDFDSFIINRDKDSALYHNIGSLLYVFQGLYKDALKNIGMDIENEMINNMTVKNYLSYLFGYTGYKEDPAKVLERKLVKTKTPRELFNI